MESVVFHLDERLANAGDSLPLTGHIDQDSYSLGEREFALPEGIEYDLVLTNAGEGILATGVLRELRMVKDGAEVFSELY